MGGCCKNVWANGLSSLLRSTALGEGNHVQVSLRQSDMVLGRILASRATLLKSDQIKSNPTIMRSYADLPDLLLYTSINNNADVLKYNPFLFFFFFSFFFITRKVRNSESEMDEIHTHTQGQQGSFSVKPL